VKAVKMRSEEALTRKRAKLSESHRKDTDKIWDRKRKTVKRKDRVRTNDHTSFTLHYYV
jgi:hypothetical protein